MLPGEASVTRQAISVAALGERGLDGLAVVVGQHQGRRRGAGGHAGRAGDGPLDAVGGQPGARLGEQGVDVAVVAAGELHDEVAAGEAAGQPDRGHGGLGARGDQAHLLDRRTARRSPRRARPRARVGVPYDVPRATASATAAWTSGWAWPSSIGPHEQIRSTYSLPSTSLQPGARPGGHETGGPAHRVEGPDRGVHPTRRDPVGALEPVGGVRRRDGAWGGRRSGTPAFFPTDLSRRRTAIHRRAGTAKS